MADVVVVNDKDEVIGAVSREAAHTNGTPHRIAVVYVVNPAGGILVQVRMDGRLDHSSAGHVDPGEQCDGSNLNNKVCTDLGLGFIGGTPSCNPSGSANQCQFDS